MRKPVVEVLARIGGPDNPPHLLARLTLADPRKAEAELAELLRAIADELEKPSAEPARVGELLPGVVRDIAHRHGGVA